MDGSLGCKTLKILLQNMLAKLLLIRLIFNPDIQSPHAFFDGQKHSSTKHNLSNIFIRINQYANKKLRMYCFQPKKI